MKEITDDTGDKDLNIHGGALKLLRVLKDINQTTVAEFLGMSRQNLDYIEKGIQNPKQKDIEQYIEFLKEHGFTSEQIAKAQTFYEDTKIIDLEQEIQKLKDLKNRME